MAKVKINWRGNKLLLQIGSGARAGGERAARIFITEAKRLITDTPKSGRMYGSHQASAPGEPPANLTGLLVNSFYHRVHQTGALVSVSIGNSARYSHYLEFGTRKMAPRPYMRPAYANKKQEMINVIAMEIQKAVK